ncbi:MAG: class I adenylate-forming enzyme family protein [Solirubrobacteraceae bacterium]
MNVSSWLRRAACLRPDRTAIETPQGSLTYAALLRACCDHAPALRAGERVAIELPSGLEFAVALHACMEAGSVAVPVDRRLAPGERARVLEGCERRWGAVAAAVAGDPETAAAPPAASADRGRPTAGPGLDAPCAVLHTSGTSGAPKAVPLTYGNLLWSALGSATAIGLDPGERWLSTLPVAHVGGLSVLLRSAIYGTTAVLHERWDTAQVLEALRGDSITVVSLVPTMLARLLDAGLSRPPSLRCALLGGAPLPPALLARARDAGVPVSQSYGLTEASSQVTTQPLGDGGEDSGAPLFCTRVELAADREIIISGPTVAAGGGPWATGDLGWIDDGGRLHVVGRKSEMIVSGGENVAPAEVEAVLLEHPGVLEAAVLGRADPEWGEAVCAVIVGSAKADELHAHCAQQLAAFKIPKQFSYVESLPRTSSGKLLRRELV